MNSQEIIFKVNSGDLNKIRKSNIPLAFIKDDGNEFGVLLHPVLGTFFIEYDDDFIISKSFFPKLELKDYYELGKFAKQLSKLRVQYKIFLKNAKQQKILFSHKITEKFYS